jgi:hypothetical protein
MRAKNLILGVLIVTVGVALYFGGRESKRDEPVPAAAEQQPTGQQAVVAPKLRVPPFRPSAEAARPLPKILPAEQFSIPVVAQAYRAARRIPEVLAQQPCYCWCDKYGHGSLVDCFATEHGAG